MSTAVTWPASTNPDIDPFYPVSLSGPVGLAILAMPVAVGHPSPSAIEVGLVVHGVTIVIV